jgi:hypothetical protein
MHYKIGGMYSLGPGMKNLRAQRSLREHALLGPVIFSETLEFVAHRELHDARIGKQAAVVAETPAAA